MSKLNNLDLYNYAQEKYDKYNSPYMTERAFQWMYSEARKEWLKDKLKQYETVEQVRMDLAPFNREKDFIATNRINLSGTAPDKVEFKVALWANFEFECNGEITVYTVPVQPVSKDQVANLLRDPFNQPTDEFPIYIEKNDGQPYLEILSTSIPQVATLSFVKAPKDFNLVSDPQGFTEEEEMQQYEILDISVKKAELTIENFGKFQGMREEIQSNG